MSFSTLKKTGIAILTVGLLTKGFGWAMGLYNLKSNLNYKIKFNRVQKVYFENLEPKVTIVLTIEILNTSNFKLNVKDYSTTILSPAGSLIANTETSDLDLAAQKSFVKDLTVTISIAQFLISLAGSYKLQYVSRFTITGIQITTPTSTLDVGPQILEATKGIAAIKTFIAAYGKKPVNGLGAISSNQLIPYIQ